MTWIAVRGWLALGVLAIIGLLIPIMTNPATRKREDGQYTLAFEDMALREINLSFGSMLTMVVAFARVTILVYRHYRCPACNQPIVDDEGVLLTPERCPNCRVPFR
jgi:hypothetical protein